MNRLMKYQMECPSPLTLMEDIVSQFFGGAQPTKSENSQTHYYQDSVVYDATAGYTIQIVLPGVAKEQLDVEMKDNVLRLSREGKLLRSYIVPKGADTDAITAELANGILTVKIPLKTVPSIKIQVK